MGLATRTAPSLLLLLSCPYQTLTRFSAIIISHQLSTPSLQQLHHPTNHPPLCTSSHIIRIRVSVCVVVGHWSATFHTGTCFIGLLVAASFPFQCIPSSPLCLHPKSPTTINPSQVKSRLARLFVLCLLCLTRYTINNR